MVDKIWDLLTSNLGTKFVSVVIALVLWTVVLGSRNVEVVKEVPLDVVTSPDMMVSSDVPERIAFKLSGPKAFLRAILDRREEPVHINLVGAKPGTVTYRFFSDNIRLPIGVKVVAISPPTVIVRLEPIKHRDLPIKVEIRGKPAEGYRIIKTEISPDFAKLKGPESKIENISEVKTIPIDITEMKETLQKEAPLDITRYGLILDGPSPVLTVQIEPSIANFRLKNVDIRVTATMNYKVEPKTVTVLVNTSQADIKKLNRSKIYATIDLRGKAKGTYKETVKVILPKNVSMVKVIPEQVDVTLY
jgi:YbbR domain-containing protein